MESNRTTISFLDSDATIDVVGTPNDMYFKAKDVCKFIDLTDKNAQIAVNKVESVFLEELHAKYQIMYLKNEKPNTKYLSILSFRDFLLSRRSDNAKYLLSKLNKNISITLKNTNIFQ